MNATSGGGLKFPRFSLHERRILLQFRWRLREQLLSR